MARYRGRISGRRAHALGFVSSIIVKRDGGGSWNGTVRLGYFSRSAEHTNRRRNWCNGQNHPLRSWWLLQADWHLEVPIDSNLSLTYSGSFLNCLEAEISISISISAPNNIEVR